MLIYPTLVQGEGASAGIVEAIEYFNHQRCADVLIVGRGGGSIEDLWAFNEEATARAIYASEIPIVSAVGHETVYNCRFCRGFARSDARLRRRSLSFRLRRKYRKRYFL